MADDADAPMPQPSRLALTTRRGLRVPDDAITVRFARSSAPGGQHVNTSSTKVDLRCDVRRIETAAPVHQRLLEVLGNEVRVVVQSERSQLRNRTEALRRLSERLDEATVVDVQRRPSQPTRASVRRRLDDKRRTSERKASRRQRSDD